VKEAPPKKQGFFDKLFGGKEKPHQPIPVAKKVPQNSQATASNQTSANANASGASFD
jgi:hypothetical protein